MKKFIAQLLIGIVSLVIAAAFIPNVSISGNWLGKTETFIVAGIVLGLINYFLKPIIELIAFPLRILTFGLFSVIINMLIIWAVDVIFPSVIIIGITPLFLTALIVIVINFIFLKLA